MRGTTSEKALLELFNKYAGAYGSDTATYYTSSHVVLIEQGAHGVRISISGHDEDVQNRAVQKDAAPFESDPLWTPARADRKATAEGMIAFIKEAKHREDNPAVSKDEAQARILRASGLRIII
ncbi:MAG TPA: hypothetical protein PLW48_10725 [Alphaproteobacteria bacterium]|nr:hypothetical protein [Alphaproteobacteria bacterium]